jgi:putative oxidoreductase
MLLIARAVIGLGIAAHGSQKLFGWFGGGGPAGHTGFFERLGFEPGSFFATVAGLAEFGGGLLLALGLLGPVGPSLIVAVMLTAILAVHLPHGFFTSNHGMELPLLYAVGASVMAVAGPGRFSLDGALGLLWMSGAYGASIALVIGAALALLAFGFRKPRTVGRAAAV